MPSCGDGEKTTGEQCDDHNLVSGDGCSATCRDERFGDLVVAWDFNTGEAGMDDPRTFTSDSCVDFVPPTTATSIEVRSISGPATPALTVGCGDGQASLSKLPIGDYLFEVTLLGEGARLISSPKKLPVAILPGQSVSPPRVTFTNADFSPPPDGTFYFQTYFGGKTGTSCAASSPAVAQQRLTLALKSGGAPVAIRTKGGASLDGGTASPCQWPSGASDTQQVEKVPSDWYRFRVEGLDAAGTTVACGTYTVFVGAGRFNPTYELVVPSAASCP